MFGNLFRCSKKAEPVKARPHSWFDSAQLNATFNELQIVVQETTSLANNISTQLENHLHTRELQLTTLLYVITEAIVITDQSGKIQEWNTGAEMLFGYTKDEAIGQPVVMLAHKADDKEVIRAGFDQTDHSDKCNIHKIRNITCNHKNGTPILAELSVNIFPDTSNNTSGMIAIIRDVTEQHKERQQHEKERALLKCVINSVMDVVMVKDPDGRWLLANKAAHDLYNFVDEDDYLNKTDFEIAKEFPQFAPSLAECIKSDREAWENRRTTRTEEIVPDQMGQRQYFDVMKTPVYSDHSTKDVLVVAARNITQLKEKREHILVAHKALNASSDIVCITDKNGYTMFANKMFLINYRYADLRDVIGKKMALVRSEMTPLNVHKQMWETITSGKTWEGVLTNMDSRHQPIKVESTIIPIVDQNLDISHYICVQKPIDR